METSYVQTFGSFVRNGKYPLEADYIFDSVEALREWEQLNRKYLHEGLFKVVITEDTQTLYWYYNGSFTPLVDANSLENITGLLGNTELSTLRDLLKDLQAGYNSRLKAIQQELDQTQNGVGLNGDGSFDQLSMKNTNYLDGSRSVIEALKALDRAVVNGDSTPVGNLSLTWEDNKIKLLQGEEVISEIDGTDFIKDGMLDRVALNQSSKILTLIFNTDSGKQNIPIDLNQILTAYDGSNVNLTHYAVPPSYVAPAHGDSVDLAVGKLVTGIRELDTKLNSKPNINQVVTSVNGLRGDVSIPTTTVPTKVSAFENDANYLTEHQSLENYYTKPEVDQAIDEKITGGAVDLSNYYNKGEIDTKFAGIEFPEDYIVSGTQTTTSTADGGNNIFTFTTKDGTTKTFVVKNGSKGSQGIQGPKGQDGAKGDKGDSFTYDDFTEAQLQSLKGEQGPKGDKGDKGERGLQGVQGVKGDTGASAKLAIGTVQSGTSAAATITGTAPNYVLNLTLPKGEKGDQGDGSDVDLSNYYTKTEVDSSINTVVENFNSYKNGVIKGQVLSQAEFNSLSTKNSNYLYIVK